MGKTQKPSDKEVIGDLVDDLVSVVSPQAGEESLIGHRERGAAAGRRHSQRPKQRKPLPLFAESPEENAVPGMSDQVVTSHNLMHTGRSETTTDAGRRMSEGSPEEQSSRQDREERGKLLDALFAGLPDDPKGRLNAVVALQHEFREKAAEALRLAIDNLLRSPPEPFAEKQALATELNRAFHELGLAVCHHESMRPCSVVANRSPSVETGYLRLQAKKGVQRQSRPTDTLDRVDLIVAPREEAFARSK